MFACALIKYTCTRREKGIRGEGGIRERERKKKKKEISKKEHNINANTLLPCSCDCACCMLKSGGRVTMVEGDCWGANTGLCV